MLRAEGIREDSFFMLGGENFFIATASRSLLGGGASTVGISSQRLGTRAQLRTIILFIVAKIPCYVAQYLPDVETLPAKSLQQRNFRIFIS